jgi:hypothetical protein
VVVGSLLRGGSQNGPEVTVVVIADPYRCLQEVVVSVGWLGRRGSRIISMSW